MLRPARYNTIVPYKTFKYRLYPTVSQEREMRQQLETLRRVYNDGLAWWINAYEKEKSGELVIPRKTDKNGKEKKFSILETLYPVFAERRNKEANSKKSGEPGSYWLTRVSSTSIRDTIARLEFAFSTFFSRVKDGISSSKVGFPRFKSANRLKSIPFNNYPGGGCILRDSKGSRILGDSGDLGKGYKIYLFGVGEIKVRLHRPIVGEIKTGCVKRDADGKWFVYFSCEMEQKAISPKVGKSVGIDLGLQYFATTSDGVHYKNHKFYRLSLGKIRKSNRSVSRKIVSAKSSGRKLKECKNLQKSILELARINAKIRNRRIDHHHKLANEIVDQYATICVESLNVQGMLKNDKLSRSVFDVAWKSFIEILKLKAENAGARVVEIDPKWTSQICPECGNLVPKSLKERIHSCHKCGYEAHRDVSAARMILKIGMKAIEAGQVSVGNNLGNKPSRQRKPPAK